MGRNLTPFCLMGSVALMFAACSSPRKASERACRKADRHLARAVWLCPDALRQDSTTITVRTEADSIALDGSYDQAITDSVLAACAQFAAAVAAERDSLQQVVERRLLGTPVRVLVPGEKGASAPTVASSTKRLRRELCEFEPISSTVGHCRCWVRPGENGPLVTLEQLAHEQRVTAPCPPHVGRAPCPPVGVDPGWRTFGIIMIVVLSLGLLMIGYLFWLHTNGRT